LSPYYTCFRHSAAIPDVLRNDASKPFHARVGDVAVQIAKGKGLGSGKIKDIKPISALVRERKEHYQASGFRFAIIRDMSMEKDKPRVHTENLYQEYLVNAVGSARELHKSLDEVLDDVRKQWRDMLEIYEPDDQ
jgi:hypothetical protein